MKPESYLKKKFEETRKFLIECDTIPESKWSLERYDAYAHAIAVYETLHDVLEIKTDAEWCS